VTADIGRPAPATREPHRLPRLVQAYFDRAVANTDTVPRLVRITQQGRMRMKPGGSWRSFTAIEEFQVATVGFSWRARFPLGPLAWLTAVDEYAAGIGRLQVRLYGTVPVVRATGEATAHAEVQRYLSELAWTPHAITANHELRWSEVDDRTIEVATSVGSSKIALNLGFDSEGDIVTASTPARGRLVGKTVIDTLWRGSFGEYAVVGGIRVPTVAEVGWDLPDGAFIYWQGRVTDLEQR